MSPNPQLTGPQGKLVACRTDALTGTIREQVALCFTVAVPRWLPEQFKRHNEGAELMCATLAKVLGN